MDITTIRVKKTKKMPKVSMVFPVYNSERFIEECLDSLLNQTFKDYELIILDDCSKDKTIDILKKKKKKYYKNKENLGLVENLNKGIKMAKGEYIMIIDHDMVYDKNYLKEMMLEKKDIMVARCYYYNDKNLIRGFGISINLLTGKVTVYGRDKYDFSTKNIEIKSGAGGTLVIKKEVFSKVSFNKAFNKFMDVDFCYNTRREGFKIFLSNAKCWHKKQKEEILNNKKLEGYYSDKKLFLKKYSPYYPLSLIPSKIKIFILKWKNK